jgi:hypothetical protein
MRKAAMPAMIRAMIASAARRSELADDRLASVTRRAAAAALNPNPVKMQSTTSAPITPTRIFEAGKSQMRARLQVSASGRTECARLGASNNVSQCSGLRMIKGSTASQGSSRPRTR